MAENLNGVNIEEENIGKLIDEVQSQIFKTAKKYMLLDDIDSEAAVTLKNQKETLTKKLDFLKSCLGKQNANDENILISDVPFGNQGRVEKLNLPQDLPKFSASNTVMVQEFLIKLENSLLASNVDKKFWVKGLLKSCSDDILASAFVRNILDSKIMDWTNIKTKFIGKFTRKDLKEKFRNEYKNLQMGASESLYSYIIRYQTLMLELNILDDDQANIEKFVDSLVTPIRKTYNSNELMLHEFYDMFKHLMPVNENDIDKVQDKKSFSQVVDKIIALRDNMSASSVGSTTQNVNQNKQEFGTYKPPFLRNPLGSSDIKQIGTASNAKVVSTSVNSSTGISNLNSQSNNISNSNMNSDRSMGNTSKKNIVVSDGYRSTIEGACWYCKKEGHYVSSCPNAPSHVKEQILKMRTTRSQANKSHIQAPPAVNVGLILPEEESQILERDNSYWNDIENSHWEDVDVSHMEEKSMDSFERFQMGFIQGEESENEEEIDEFSLIVELNKYEVTAYGDTGAGASFIDIDWINLEKSKVDYSNPATFRMVFKNMEVVRRGTYIVEVKYGNKIFSHKFFVGEIYDKKIFPYRVLIGKELLKKFGIGFSGIVFPSRKSNEMMNPFKEEEIMDTIKEEEVSLEDPRMFEIKKLVQENQLLPHGCTAMEADIVVKPDCNLSGLFRKNYNIAAHKMGDIKKIIDEWFKDEIIEIAPFQCPYNNALVIVPKPDNTFRICLDFRPLNQALQEESIDKHFLPDIWRNLQSFFHGKVFYSELDLSNAFLQIPLKESARNFTAFTFNNTQFRFCYTPFGLKFVSNLFQRLLNQLLVKHNLMEFTLAYIDNIIIASTDMEQHIIHIKAVIEALNSIHLKLKPSKIKLCKKSIIILGHQVSQGVLSVCESRKSDIRNFVTPISTKNQLQSFLGLVNQTMSFVEDFAELAMPLYNLLRKENFKWTEEAEAAIQRFKQLMETDLILFTPDLNHKFVVYTDASRKKIAGVLTQHIDGRIRVIEHFSRKLKDYECNYAVYKLELLAIITVINKFKYYLLGKRFTIMTDHKPLIYLYTAPNLSPILSGWLEFLLLYDFEVTFVPGKLNSFADYLTRNETCAEEENRVEKEIFVGQVLETNSQEGIDSIDMNLFQDTKLLDDQKYHLIELLHRKFHFGHNKMVNHIKINLECNWENISAIVQKVIDNCLICIKYNIAESGFHTIGKISGRAPLEFLCMDLAEMPSSQSGYKWILVVIDVFTAYTWLIPLKTKHSEVILASLMDIFLHFGFPKHLRTDNENCMSSALLESYFEKVGIHRSFSIEYVPRSNGIVERCIKTVKSLLFKLSYGKIQIWDLQIPMVQYICNHSIRNGIKVSPFMLMFGRKSFEFITTENEFNPYLELSENELDKITSRWNKRWNEINETLYPAIFYQVIHMKEARNEKWMAERKKVEEQLKIGSVVLIKDLQRSSKWEPIFIGPYIIIEVSTHGYKLMDGTGEILNRIVPMEQIKLTKLKELEPEYVVDEILQDQFDGEIYQYMVKWKNSWIAEELVDNLKPQINKILKSESRMGKIFKLISWKNTWENQNYFVDPQIIKKYWDQKNRTN